MSETYTTISAVMIKLLAILCVHGDIKVKYNVNSLVNPHTIDDGDEYYVEMYNE